MHPPPPPAPGQSCLRVQSLTFVFVRSATRFLSALRRTVCRAKCLRAFACVRTRTQVQLQTHTRVASARARLQFIITPSIRARTHSPARIHLNARASAHNKTRGHMMHPQMHAHARTYGDVYGPVCVVCVRASCDGVV